MSFTMPNLNFSYSRKINMLARFLLLKTPAPYFIKMCK